MFSVPSIANRPIRSGNMVETVAPNAVPYENPSAKSAELSDDWNHKTRLTVVSQHAIFTQSVNNPNHVACNKGGADKSSSFRLLLCATLRI